MNKRFSAIANTMECHHDISILSWNIHDVKDSVTGSKTQDQDFLNIIQSSDIFCLQETKGEVKIPGYRCHNKLRKDSRSGGLCIGIKREIESHTKLVNTTKFDDMMALTISKELTNTANDIAVINVYDSPEQSSYKAKKQHNSDYRETLESLENLINDLEGAWPILAGDFNARRTHGGSVSRTT